MWVVEEVGADVSDGGLLVILSESSDARPDVPAELVVIPDEPEDWISGNQHPQCLGAVDIRSEGNVDLVQLHRVEVRLI